MKIIKIVLGCFFALGALNGIFSFILKAPILVRGGNPMGVSYMLGQLVGLLMCVIFSILLFKSAFKKPVPAENPTLSDTPLQK